MLVLTRKPGEKLVIDGGIVLTLVEIQGNRVRIGIEAPQDIRVLRGERAVNPPRPFQELAAPVSRLRDDGKLALIGQAEWWPTTGLAP